MNAQSKTIKLRLVLTEEDNKMTDLEKKFDRAMREIYMTAKRDCGYNATRFLQLVGEKGGLVAAKQLLGKSGGTDGFTTPWEHGRLDLSVEAHVLKPEYESLFTEEERQTCRRRLEEFGYRISGGWTG